MGYKHQKGKHFRIGSSTLTGFLVVFWAPNALRYPGAAWGGEAGGREGRSLFAEAIRLETGPSDKNMWSHIHPWSIIAIQIILTYLDNEPIIVNYNHWSS